MLRKTVVDHQCDWHERLPEALWYYRNSAYVSNGVAPFIFVYEIEAISLLEVELPILTMATTSQLLPDQAEYVASRIASLEVIDKHHWLPGEKLKKYH